MLRFLIDENRIRRALSEFPPETFRQLQEALDKLVIPEYEEPAVVEPPQEAAMETVVTPIEAIPQPGEEVRRPKPQPVQAIYDDEDEDVEVLAQGKKGKGKKNKGRQLVYDEKTGGMVVKRQRKGGRGDWNNWDE